MTNPPKACRSRLLTMALTLPLTVGACERAATATSELDGHWWSKDYGLVLQVTGDEVLRIEQTAASCLSTYSSSVEKLRQSLAAPPDREHGVLVVGSDTTLSAKSFTRLDEVGFEQLCPDGLTKKPSDPIANFEVLWRTFDQHYAFFTERDVDWDAVYAEYRPKITEDMSSRELAQTFGSMLNRLQDAHVGLYVDGNDVVSVDTTVGASLFDECRRLLGEDCNYDDYVDDQYEDFYDALKAGYLDGEIETGLNGHAFWGEIDDRTGYVQIDAMEGFAKGAYSSSADLEEIDTVFDEVLDDIGDLPTMIVDVRLNGGGHDTVAVAIASRFADQRWVFGSKRAFAGGEEAVSTDLVVEAHDGERFEGDVALLISGETASAAEIFAMAMRALPNVTLIGTSTQGILSDELYRTLPNGWEFSLSNEIYLTHDGALFEATGVPPKIEAAFMLAEDLEREVDPGIETALTFLAEKAGLKGKSH